VGELRAERPIAGGPRHDTTLFRAGRFIAR